MPSVSVPAAIVGSAVIGAGAQLGSSAIAAGAQQKAYAQTRADLSPFRGMGVTAEQQLQGMGPFSFKPTIAQLEQTPGYQFDLYQGLKSTQNAAAARGLGVSGAALKGAAAYATGLAQNTYMNQFDVAQQTYGTNANKLMAMAQLGEGAAAQQAVTGASLAGNIGQIAMAGGQAVANAAGTIGSVPLLNQMLQNGGGMYGNTGLNGSAAGGGYGQGFGPF